MKDDKNDNDIITGRLFTLPQVIRIVISVATAVFVLTTIYNRFIFLEQELQVVSDRLEKKTSRIESDNVNQWNAINELQRTQSKK